MPFGMMADEDRLAQGDPVSERSDCIAGTGGILGAVLAVFGEPFGAIFGPLGQACVFVADAAGAEFGSQGGTGGSPHRRDEDFLLRCPGKPCGLNAGISVRVETTGGIDSQLVVFR